MRAEKKRMCSVCVLLLLATGLCTGCGQLEIEDRAFPLALAVAPAEQENLYEFSFFFEEMETEGSSLYHKEDAVVTAGGYPQAFTVFGRAQAAGLDDSHMQVILLAESLLRDTDFLDSFYGYYMKEHHFSWNTMVYLLDDASIKPEELKESTGGRTGTYLRGMAESDEQEKTAGVPTLGDLYMEWNNRETILLLPVLSDSTPPSVDHYRMLVRGRLGEKLTADETRVLQFLWGDLKKMQLELSDGTVVRLEDIRRHGSYVSPDDIWQMTIHAECSVENRINLSAIEKDRIRRESERILRQQLERMEQWAPVKDAGGQLMSAEYEINMTWME